MAIKVEIKIKEQKLFVHDQHTIIAEFDVSTAKNGTGQDFGSECTPLGKHIIRAKIGAASPENAVFVARRPTGEIYTEQLRDKHPDRDWILTRILWLSGKEKGFNRLGKVDTMRRYIYIHGCPDSDKVGIPGSHGCIKLHNKDMFKLFDLLPVYTEVNIVK